jgi:chorismate dehydratase
MKVGISDFLNEKPLTGALDRQIEKLHLSSPRQCALALEAGEVDFAILPSIEYARIPDLTIVPNISISCWGPVQSVLLFLNKDAQEVKKAALDQKSRTAAALLKILFNREFKLQPEYIESAPDLNQMLAGADAALLIGDDALKASRSFSGQVLDLGEIWYEMTGLPFTFAFWAGRKAQPDPLDLVRIMESKEKGMKSLDKLAEQEADDCLDEDFILEYLAKRICYDSSPSHEKGLKLFYEYAFELGLIEKVPDLKFYEVESYHF